MSGFLTVVLYMYNTITIITMYRLVQTSPEWNISSSERHLLPSSVHNNNHSEGDMYISKLYKHMYVSRSTVVVNYQAQQIT